ncbi:hypothetical protein SS50377_22264 [Spironucleus salmonicida]|uniref:Uncharacterized protein n=1 Tax=Spironucleus salmonicida TaxID=348837 RepID=V6LCR5_9EUKA|nr:hypothetical protein SS50377_22264 [Spironucleus salmonicida]|eukprot:EST42242.1 Hypothetical protein SS50377_18544 [Spironucleus salmonicida]
MQRKQNSLQLNDSTQELINKHKNSIIQILNKEFDQEEYLNNELDEAYNLSARKLVLAKSYQFQKEYNHEKLNFDKNAKVIFDQIQQMKKISQLNIQ